MSSVSVIIPCYNCGHFLPAAIESVLAKTYRDLELIVADDSSTDNGVEIAERYIEVESFVECLQRCPDCAFAYGHQQFIDAAVTRHPQYESDYRLGIRRARSYWGTRLARQIVSELRSGRARAAVTNSATLARYAPRAGAVAFVRIVFGRVRTILAVRADVRPG
jgi:glycosyltransferase involved in cell wall biosynthesis